MTRRSIWDDEDNVVTAPSTGTGWGSLDGAASSTMAQPPSILQPPPPRSILDQLRAAPAKPEAIRNRSWEREHPNKAYRRVPYQIRDKIKQIAKDYGYSASYVAQAFLEYAVMCYRRGDFELKTELGSRGQTLIPQGWKPTWTENIGGTQPKKRKKPQNKKTTQLYKQMVNYRLDYKLIVQIDDICDTLRDPNGRLVSRRRHDGEVVARLLAFAIDAYQAGRLALLETNYE